jgi:hypothetical protein
MHRSGTSLVARLLHGAGLHLGPPARLLGPTERNPRGYWEHDGLTTISEELLQRLGGSWREPPDPPRGWAGSPGLDELEELGRTIIGEGFPPDAAWGWKDPRLSLTLPFWRRIAPAVRPVLCVRAPAEVAASTARSVEFEGFDAPGPKEGLWLWARYVSAALRSVGPDPVLVTGYERVLAGPEAELRRLAGFAGLAVPANLAAQIREVDPSLRRARPDASSSRREPAVVRRLHRALEDLAAAEGPAAAPRDLIRLAAEAEAELRPRPRATAAARPPRPGRLGPGLTVSVALATFDGRPYVEELLASLAAQSRPPDEVVACDDGSADGTLEVLRSFAASAPFPVRVVSNPRRLGSTKNFEQALRLCRGEVILLADQDDVWMPEKVASFASAFAARPDLGMRFTDAEVIDQDGTLAGTRLWKAFGIGPARAKAYRAGGPAARVEQLLRGNLMTGACLGFRSRHRDLILPVPHTWVQDAWIGMLLSAVGETEMSPEPLVRYRVHGGQQIGLGVGGLTVAERLRRRRQVVRRMTKEERPAFFREADNVRMAAVRLRRVGGEDVDPQVVQVLDEKAAHFLNRGSMPEAPARVRMVASEVARGRYGRYSNGWTSAAKDLLLLDRLGRR